MRMLVVLLGIFLLGSALTAACADNSETMATATATKTAATRAPIVSLKQPTVNTDGCDPSYPDVCLKDGIGDYDCAGGSGNGPNYIAGPIRVLPPDPFGLDRDHNGWGCEKQ